VKRVIWIKLLLVLCLLPAACKSPEAENPGVAESPGAETSPEAGTAAPELVATAVQDASGTALPAASDPGTPGAPPTVAATAGPSPTTDPAVVELLQNFKLPGKGPEDAPVTVYEFSDYLCPYCRQYAEETGPEVDRNYVDSGQVRFVFWDFPLGSHGWPAIISAEAAHCAGEQDLYWPMHDTLFADWRTLADIQVDDEAAALEGVLAVAGKAAGIDAESLRACVEAEKYRPVIAVLLKQASEDFKIRATPSFAIVTQLPGADQPPHVQLVEGFYPYPDLKDIFDREIARSQGTPIPDPTATGAVPSATGAP